MGLEEKVKCWNDSLNFAERTTFMACQTGPYSRVLRESLLWEMGGDEEWDGHTYSLGILSLPSGYSVRYYSMVILAHCKSSRRYWHSLAIGNARISGYHYTFGMGKYRTLPVAWTCLLGILRSGPGIKGLLGCNGSVPFPHIIQIVLFLSFQNGKKAIFI